MIVDCWYYCLCVLFCVCCVLGCVCCVLGCVCGIMLTVHMLPLKRKCNSVARSSINATGLQIVSRETPNITPHTKTPNNVSGCPPVAYAFQAMPLTFAPFRSALPPSSVDLDLRVVRCSLIHGRRSAPSIVDASWTSDDRRLRSGGPRAVVATLRSTVPVCRLRGGGRGERRRGLVL